MIELAFVCGVLAGMSLAAVVAVTAAVWPYRKPAKRSHQ